MEQGEKDVVTKSLNSLAGEVRCARKADTQAMLQAAGGGHSRRDDHADGLVQQGIVEVGRLLEASQPISLQFDIGVYSDRKSVV